MAVEVSPGTTLRYRLERDSIGLAVSRSLAQGSAMQQTALLTFATPADWITFVRSDTHCSSQSSFRRSLLAAGLRLLSSPDV